MAGLALSVTLKKDWNVDSGAISHMSNSRELFKELNELVFPQQVAVGMVTRLMQKDAHAR